MSTRTDKYITTSFRYDIYTSELIMDIISYMEDNTGLEINTSDAIRWAIKQTALKIAKERGRTAAQAG